jgi:hypothetical protein
MSNRRHEISHQERSRYKLAGGTYGCALQAAAEARLHGIDWPFIPEEFSRCAKIEALLEAGANVNAEGGIHGTALKAAVIFGTKDTIELLELLLQNGADINIRRGVFGTALNVAVQLYTEDEMLRTGRSGFLGARRNIARMLLENGAVVDEDVMEGARKLAMKR